MHGNFRVQPLMVLLICHSPYSLSLGGY